MMHAQWAARGWYVDALEPFPYPSHHFYSLVLLQAFPYYFSFVYMYVAASKQYV